jgi:hypothetical protein
MTLRDFNDPEGRISDSKDCSGQEQSRFRSSEVPKFRGSAGLPASVLSSDGTDPFMVGQSPEYRSSGGRQSAQRSPDATLVAEPPVVR